MVRQSSFQQFLFDEIESPIVVTPEKCDFDPYNYPCSTYDKGHYKFSKHYYLHVGELEDKGEEHECAQFIDSLPRG
jgi:type III restriction enzyme